MLFLPYSSHITSSKSIMNRTLLYALIIFYAGCTAHKEETRYQTLENLEQPPGLTDLNNEEEKNEATQLREINQTSKTTVYAEVYRKENSERSFWIKSPIDDAWNQLKSAIISNELIITGKNKKKGMYEVEYAGENLFGNFTLFGSGSPSKYLIKLESQDKETKVSATMKEEKIDESILKDGAPEFPYDNSSKLIGLLFETMRNKNRP